MGRKNQEESSIYGSFMKSQSVTKIFADNQEGEQVWQENGIFQFSQVP